MLYTYSVTSMAVSGIVFRRLPSVLIITAVAASTYLTATVWRFGFSPALVDNSSAYGLFACLSGVLTVRFRRRELGLDPGPELRLLHQQILTRDPVLDLPGPRRRSWP